MAPEYHKAGYAASQRSPERSELAVFMAVILVALASTTIPREGTAQQLPRPIEPGLSRELPRPPEPERPPEEVTIERPAERAPPGAEQLIVEVRQINIEGSTIYSEEELRSFYQDIIGKEVPLLRIFQLADAIEERYREDGYPLVRVVVPAQTVTGGVFRIRVIEGFVGRVRIEGEVGAVRPRIQAYLQKIVDVRPVTDRVLERYLLLVNDLPGVTASGVLRPGTGELGAADLVVQVARKPFEAAGVANNRGSEFTGPWRGLIQLRENAATRLAERVQVTGATAGEEEVFTELLYTQHIGTEGLTLRLRGQYEATQPGFTLEPLDIETDVIFGDVATTYPLLRSRRQNIYVALGFEAIRWDVDVLGDPLNRDDLRVLRAGVSYDFADPWGNSAIEVQVRQGLEILGASEAGDSNLSRAEGRPDFTSFQFAVSRLQPLVGPVTLLLAAKAQVALDTLLAYEEFTLGGEQFGRGYEPGELAGDDGYGVSAELQYSGTTPFRFLPTYQLYGFYDVGKVFNDDPPLAGDDEEKLESAGGGLRTRITDNLFFDFEVAKPLNRERLSDGEKSAQFFFNISTIF